MPSRASGRGRQLRRHPVHHPQPELDVLLRVVRVDHGPGQVAQPQVGDQHGELGAGPVVQTVRVRQPGADRPIQATARSSPARSAAPARRAPRAARSTSRATSASGGPSSSRGQLLAARPGRHPGEDRLRRQRVAGHVVRRALGRAAGLVAGQRPPPRPVDVEGVADQPGRQRLDQAGQQGPSRVRLGAVGEQHQLVDRRAAGPDRGAGRRTRPPRSGGGRSTRAVILTWPERTKTVTSDSTGWKPSWKGIRASRSAGPRARSRVRSSLSSASAAAPSRAAAHPPRRLIGAARSAVRSGRKQGSCRQDADPRAPRAGPAEICGQRRSAPAAAVDKPAASLGPAAIPWSEHG